MDHPVLDAIRRAEQPVRMYALNGYALAFANEIEDTMFWCYVEASGMSWEDAADLFYEKVKFSSKQDRADKAVKARVAGTAHADTWRKLNQRIQGLLGEGNSLRNLIGHNSVSLGIWGTTEKVGKAVKLADLQIRQTVFQKRAMVERRDRPKASVTEQEMADYGKKLTELYVDLEAFLTGVLGCDPKRRQQYSHVW